MLEQLKKEVYEANMLLPKEVWSHIHGEMSVELIEKVVYLLLNQVVWIMTNFLQKIWLS